MASFFLSAPGVVATTGLVGLCVLARPRTALQAVAPVTSRMTAQIAVSGVVLAAGLWVLLSGRYDGNAQQWASGVVGTVVGYWLK